MKESMVRFRIPEHLYVKYKIFCLQRKLSVAKQSASLIKNFIEIQEDNERKIIKS